MIAAFDLSAIAQVTAARIVGCFVEGTLVALLAASGLSLMRGVPAATRFAIWFSALIAITLLALLGLAPHAAGPVTNTGVVHRILILPEAWALYIFAAWAAIAGILLVRVGIGTLHVFRLHCNCVPLDPDSLASGLRASLEQPRNSRRVALCTSDLVNVPTAIGWMRPAILLPEWMVRELSSADLRQIVLHELAHLRRWDDWTNLAQQFVKALLFFHPAVWWMEKKAALEREMACDDAVVLETANPRAYAECLAHLAERSMIRRGLALAQAAVGRMRETSLRVARILRTNPLPAKKYGVLAAGTAITGVALACGILASRMPSLIAFEHPQSQVLKAQAEPMPARPAAPVNADARPAATRTAGAHVTRAKSRVRTDQRVPQLERWQTVSPPAPTLARWEQPSVRSSPVSRAIYVVIESSEYPQAGVIVWRSSVWKITLVPAVNSNPKIPRKQT